MPIRKAKITQLPTGYLADFTDGLPGHSVTFGPNSDLLDMVASLCRFNGISWETARVQYWNHNSGTDIELKIEYPDRPEVTIRIAVTKCPGCDGKGHYTLLTTGRTVCDQCRGSGRV